MSRIGQRGAGEILIGKALSKRRRGLSAKALKERKAEAPNWYRVPGMVRNGAGIVEPRVEFGP